ncbi:MAG: hypothetical protein ACYC9W_07475 [Candidatus Limnocylindria bacterium]
MGPGDVGVGVELAVGDAVDSGDGDAAGVGEVDATIGDGVGVRVEVDWIGRVGPFATALEAGVRDDPSAACGASARDEQATIRTIVTVSAAAMRGIRPLLPTLQRGHTI